MSEKGGYGIREINTCIYQAPPFKIQIIGWNTAQLTFEFAVGTMQVLLER